MSLHADLPPALRLLRDRSAEAALFLDYDGTLSPIVDDPARAVPFPGVPELLGRLAARFALVAVVSGRPARFLLDALGSPSGVHLAGLYGMEEVDGTGHVVEDGEAARWRPIVDEVTRALGGAAPPGAEVEAKGLSVALHWRRAPQVESRVIEVAREAGARVGLELQPGRMSVELRPPVAADKGTVVARLAAGHRVVAYVGDDAGDLPAFAVLDRLEDEGVTVVRVAVADPESPAGLADAADVVVRSPADVAQLLSALAD